MSRKFSPIFEGFPDLGFGFFLFKPFFLNSLALQKAKRIRRGFFGDEICGSKKD